MTFSDSGAHVSQILDCSIQTHLLAHWVRDRQAFTLEEAVRMLTLVAGDGLGIHRTAASCARASSPTSTCSTRPGWPPRCRPSSTTFPAGPGGWSRRPPGFSATVVGGEVVLRAGAHDRRPARPAAPRSAGRRVGARRAAARGVARAGSTLESTWREGQGYLADRSPSWRADRVRLRVPAVRRSRRRCHHHAEPSREAQRLQPDADRRDRGRVEEAAGQRRRSGGDHYRRRAQGLQHRSGSELSLPTALIEGDDERRHVPHRAEDQRPVEAGDRRGQRYGVRRGFLHPGRGRVHHRRPTPPPSSTRM